ncbi:MAG: SDR family oxidoreductase [Hyphomicrobiales bacterium]|nr:SDR family oxidoreductase [Hyphomicrobiales bacterium]
MAEDSGTALITGAAHRIGRAIALHLASHGWRIGVHYRSSQAEAKRLVDHIQTSGGSAAAIYADLSDIGAVQTLPGKCADQLGTANLLINNASLFEDDKLQTASLESWDAHMACNVRAPVFLTQAFALLAPHNSCVVNIIDQRVLKPSPEFFSYSASKAALWAVTRTMAQALAPRIRVNAIGPGPVLPSIHQTPEDFADECESTLLKRGVEATEIAAAVRFILDSPSMTGQLIALDAGQHLS